MQVEQPALDAQLGTLADVVPLYDLVDQKPLKICLLGYRSSPTRGGQGVEGLRRAEREA